MITATRADTGWGRFRADFQAEPVARIPEQGGDLARNADSGKLRRFIPLSRVA
jgi:hypothetical protein